jgi:hypothetical protein
VNHSTRQPTKSEQRRFVEMKYLGCVACIVVDPTDPHAEAGGG